jgi:hypothetical protein
MKTPRRSSFHHLLVASSGARRSTSRARASAARRTWSKVHFRWIRTLTWMPRDPEVFGHPRSPRSSSTSRTSIATLAHVFERDPRHRVEVDAKLVGVLEVVGADRVRVEVDAAEVDDPEQLRGVAHDDLARGAPRRELQLDRLDPVRVLLGSALLEERLGVGAVDVALQDDRPAGDPAKRAVGDREVVPREVELRVARLREEDLLGIRDDDLAAGGLENHLGVLRHAESLRARYLSPSTA